MNITIDFRMLRNSGITSYLLNLVPLLVRTHPEAHFSLLGDPQQIACHSWARANNVTVIECTAPIYSLSEQWSVAARIPAETDVLWVPHYNIPLLYRGRMMVTVHDLAHLALPQYAGAIHKRLYARWMFQSLRGKASAVICDSRFTAAELTGHTRGRQEQLRVIHLGVSEEWFRVPKGPRPHERPYFLYVGNVKPHKNIHGLLEAFEQVQDRLPQDLLIVGRRDGFITPDEAVTARASALGDRVRFTGHVDFATLQQLFVHSDALLFPSFYEGFGLPPLEAMACGCPVVVSNTASLPEVCGDCALYCDPYQPSDIAARVLQIAGDGDLRAELSRRGVGRARQFTWENTAKATWQVLQEALAPGPKRGQPVPTR